MAVQTGAHQRAQMNQFPCTKSTTSQLTWEPPAARRQRLLGLLPGGGGGSGGPGALCLGEEDEDLHEGGDQKQARRQDGHPLPGGEEGRPLEEPEGPDYQQARPRHDHLRRHTMGGDLVSENGKTTRGQLEEPSSSSYQERLPRPTQWDPRLIGEGPLGFVLVQQSILSSEQKNINPVQLVQAGTTGGQDKSIQERAFATNMSLHHWATPASVSGNSPIGWRFK